jgi:hypothetical protein
MAVLPLPGLLEFPLERGPEWMATWASCTLLFPASVSPLK